jgi:hypothetical protein
MTDRMVEGFKLFQKGNVEIIFEDDEIIQLEVKSKKKQYLVEYDKEEGVIRCLCPDYHGRHQKANGSFLCKHNWSCVFKLAQVRGVHSQEVLV